MLRTWITQSVNASLEFKEKCNILMRQVRKGEPTALATSYGICSETLSGLMAFMSSVFITSNY